MAYTPPNTLTNGTTLTASDLQGNFEALRVYLHSGIVQADIDSSKWIDTRHVQPPVYEPFSGIQHGVTGHQGGQWAGGENIRLTFCTKFLTGGGVQGSNDTWRVIPNTAIRIETRREAKLVFHYWYELECGPDDSTGGQQVASGDRLVWVAPYIGEGVALKQTTAAQESQNHQEGWNTSYPIGADKPYPVCGGYGQRDGTVVYNAPLGSTTIGLCQYSQIDRVAVVNWGIAIETFYL
jgi:hypothetical protein